MKRVITQNFDVERMREIDIARAHGAYAALPQLAGMDPDRVVACVEASGLRGRGGAGFPTARKWKFLPRDGRPVYLIVNADESEPGTFKDRAIIERDPHLVIEGIVIAAYAIGAKAVYVYFRGEYARPSRIFEFALEEARKEGLTTMCLPPSPLPQGGGKSPEMEIHIRRGAGGYICGEETALINSVEGMRAMPRIKPPFPAGQGLFGCPTIVNNVETIAALPFIIREGADVYRSMGTPDSPGTKLVSVSGHVNNPGVYEVEMGTPIARFLADECGGTPFERALKAIIPGGPSVAVLTAAEALGARIDHESLARAGSQLGSGGMIVMDETASMPQALADITRFFEHESCGRCTPCREGTGWLGSICRRIVSGQGRITDIDCALSVARALPGRTVCAFGDAVAAAVTSFITKFRGEFEETIGG